MKKVALFVVLLVFLNGFSPAEDLRFQLALGGGFSHIFEYGSETDYVQRENDFPVTPAHTPLFFGLSFSYFLTGTLKLELDGRHAFGSKITLVDPSDADSVEVATAAQSFVSLNICYQCSRCNFSPYLSVGGGVSRIGAKDKTYTTEYGYEIECPVPEKKTALMLQMGWGLDLAIRAALGVRLDVRFCYLFTESDNVPILFAGVGAYYLF